jgi:deoxyribonuclease V
MLINFLHEFEVTVKRAYEIQNLLAQQVIQTGDLQIPKTIAGLDVSVQKGNEAIAACVVLNYPDLNIIEVAVSKGIVKFPYIPGLLSFREMPITLEVCAKVKSNPDLILVDGQGIAHPRKMGLASHLGLFLNKRTIGCAKTPLFGNFTEPAGNMGCYSFINDNSGNVIGAVLKTKSGVKPLFVSIGHAIDLKNSIDWVLRCCSGYRIPEPTRLAHLASKGNLC